MGTVGLKTILVSLPWAAFLGISSAFLLSTSFGHRFGILKGLTPVCLSPEPSRELMWVVQK